MFCQYLILFLWYLMPAWCALITGITVGSTYIYMTTILYEGDLHISGKNKKIISSGALPLFDFNPRIHDFTH